MKYLLPPFVLCLLAGSVAAEFRSWTNKEGKTVELDLISVTETDGEKVGEFRLRNGKKTTVKASAFGEADAKLLQEWKPKPLPNENKGAFDKVLDENLIKLDGKSFEKIKDFKKPSTYYLFYYTASWCGPCKQFTPSLVDFYKNNKSDEFEIILISADQNEDAMQSYAHGAKMEWPHLKHSMIDKFRKEFPHPGSGIPNLVLCDIEGKMIMGSYTAEGYIGPAPVMNHLAKLLKK